MENTPTWIVKVEMENPQAVPEIVGSGEAVYTKEDVERLHLRLRDGLPYDAPRRLINAVLQGAGLVAFFETSTEPSPEECRSLYRLTASALSVFRRPRKFRCVKTYPGPTTEIDYRP